jgi:hypothetical protein
MSHHLDSPIARQDIRLDITDLYVFRGETGAVFEIHVCHSIFGPIPAPGYHPEGMCEFKVDLNGDAVEDLTYRITFDERDEQAKQRYVVRRIRGAQAVDPHGAGTVLTQGTTGEALRRRPASARGRAGLVTCFGFGIGKESVTSKPSTTFPYVRAAKIEERLAA